MQAHRPLPRRTLARGKGGLADENATAKLARPLSVAGNGSLGASRIPIKDSGVVKGRAALGEVTFTNINLRKQGNDDGGPKRAQAGLGSKAPLAVKGNNASAFAVNKTRLPPQRRPVAQENLAQSRPVSQQILVEEDEEGKVVVDVDVAHDDNAMDVQDEPTVAMRSNPSHQTVQHLAAPIIMEEEEEIPIPSPKEAPIWPDIGAERQARAERQLQQAEKIHRDADGGDPNVAAMVSEYCDEIFEYMREAEPSTMPSPDYINSQPDFDWDTRERLVDWMTQVHLRFHLMPETLWIAVNIIDRFLSKRTVSVLKLQLVGVTALFIAAKYEEIMAPAVDEFIFLCEGAISKEDVFKGERIILDTLGFNVSQYCSPYTWMRKISKADEYELQTRTLAKFISEVILHDYRFLRASPRLTAAVSMYTARRMLNDDWNSAFVYHSGFTEEHIYQGYQMLLEKLTTDEFTRLFVCKKYSAKRFLKVSLYAVNWARLHVAGDGAVQPH